MNIVILNFFYCFFLLFLEAFPTLIWCSLKAFSMTSLHFACNMGFLDIVQILLEVAPDLINKINNEKLTPIHVACHNGHYKIVKYIFQKYDFTSQIKRILDSSVHENINHSTLSNTDKSQYSDIILPDMKNMSIFYDDKSTLKDNKKNEDVKKLMTLLFITLNNGNLRLSKYFINYFLKECKIKKKYFYSILFKSCYSGNLHVVKYILKQNICDINWRDNPDKSTALFVSCYGMFPDIVHILLKQKSINVNAKGKFSMKKLTPLQLSLQLEFFEIAKKLISHKNIKINKRDEYGDTALHYAIIAEKVEIVSMILRHPNIKINRRNNRKIIFYIFETPLHIACHVGDKEIVTLLLENINIKTNVVDILLFAFANDFSLFSWFTPIQHTNRNDIIDLINNYTQ
ncbi:hypothetical protein TRFO_08251 [Tritrichomonas foetus]|uniref:Uncharacterized protein n=1 Tax=Tritrichomonas foetus TaxID=1144522 RepID=A0A1J4JMH9_9EUKA|nr:hypothetical protein TRFO_08251 [Tritrichomonas foetus]|eukprot:OHS99639.1 hypothetical protein TRFO_08251 [Tritrichomonas foetus]